MASASTSVTNCRNCSSVAAELWCKDCKNSYCTKCATGIHSQPALENHQRMPIAEKPVELKACNKHPDEKLKFWCSCKTLVCRDCQRSRQHKDHTSELIEEVALDITEQVKAKFDEANKSVNQAIAQRMVSDNSNESTNIKQITDTFNILRQKLNDYEETLKKQVRTIEARNTKIADNYLAFLNSKQTELLARRSSFDQIVSVEDYTQLLGSHTTLTDHLDRLTSELKALKAPINIKYQLKDIEKLPSSLDNIFKEARIGE